ncbi:hypothetical protein HZ326_31025 [Fusarium oxysporum f. sp. albedinis]|nr:hypothetical protein HZ326_31025 [Fusarium oxysporum f. sp. albedinis]
MTLSSLSVIASITSSALSASLTSLVELPPFAAVSFVAPLSLQAGVVLLLGRPTPAGPYLVPGWCKIQRKKIPIWATTHNLNPVSVGLPGTHVACESSLYNGSCSHLQRDESSARRPVLKRIVYAQTTLVRIGRPQGSILHIDFSIVKVSKGMITLIGGPIGTRLGASPLLHA